MRIVLEIVITMTLRLWALLFLSSVLAACGGPNFMDKTKIDGSVLRGTPVMNGDLVHGRTVYIAKNFSVDINTPGKFNKFGLCTGVIIDSQFVVTAAHCAANLEESRVIFTDDANQPVGFDQVYSVVDFRVPDAYKASKFLEAQHSTPPGPDNRSHRYDVAVLKVDRPILNAVYSQTYFKDVHSEGYFSSKKHTQSKIEAIVAGYGRVTEYTKMQNDPLYKNQIKNNQAVPALNGTLMKAKMTFNINELSGRTILRSQRFASGVCSGDSGAPLFLLRDQELYLQAIAIATFKVKMEDPDNLYNTCYGESIYLNLDDVKSWLKESIRVMDKLVRTDSI